MPIAEQTIVARARAVRSGRQSVAAIVDDVLGKIERESASSQAYVSVTSAEARRRARELAAESEGAGPRSPLHGIPLCVKDNVDVRGTATTCGSTGRRGVIADEDAQVCRLLQAEGAVLVGKTQMYEYAYGPHVEELGVPQNPRFPGVATGGSSSGTAVAVAGGMALGGIGTDTGGSVRVPAACCGLVGMKPTNGMVSMAGVTPLSVSLDAVGPIARTVRDADVLLQGMVEREQRQAMYGHGQVRVHRVVSDVDGMRVGVVSPRDIEPCDPRMIGMVERACEILEARGAEIAACRLPSLARCQAAHRFLMLSEAFATHRVRLRDERSGFHPVTWTKMVAGGAILAQDYLGAIAIREETVGWFDREVRAFDLFVLPTLPCLPPRGGDEVVVGGQKSRFGQQFTRFTFLANLVGFPSLSMPFGTADERPLSLQLLGRPGDDRTVLRVGALLESCGPG